MASTSKAIDINDIMQFKVNACRTKEQKEESLRKIFGSSIPKKGKLRKVHDMIVYKDIVKTYINVMIDELVESAEEIMVSNIYWNRISMRIEYEKLYNRRHRDKIKIDKNYFKVMPILKIKISPSTIGKIKGIYVCKTYKIVFDKINQKIITGFKYPKYE